MEFNSQPTQFISIDDNGRVLQINTPITDVENLKEIFFEMHFSDNGALVTHLNNEPCLVEYVDQPLIAKKCFLDSHGDLRIALDHDINYPVQKESLCIDEWDRYHGLTAKSAGLPFVLSAAAQNDFFNIVDSFSDDAYVLQGTEYATPEYWNDQNHLESSDHWSQIYQTEEFAWDLGRPAPGLVDLYPKLKLPVSRVAVIGGGTGHDAAFFANLGHYVTLIDFSSEAIARAKKQYGDFTNLTFVQADAFDLPDELKNSFDLVFEHTCYCAINPVLRNDLIKSWRSLLHDTGQILGVFFTMEKRNGPPFGGSEWELKNRFKNNFKPLIWQRCKTSIKGRWGKELVVLAQKKP